MSATLAPSSQVAAAAVSAVKSTTSFISQLPTSPDSSISTVPSNGDLNPYGVARVPRGFLVTNFNSSSNLQGTGTTIMRVQPSGKVTQFAQTPAGTGLTAAIGVMSKGFAFVGSLPTTDGTSATVGQGSLLILDRNGKLLGQVRSARFLDGPWGMAVQDKGDTANIFISNALSGTVTRLFVKIEDGRPVIKAAYEIASGYTTRTDPAALVLGPQGLAYDSITGTLYVASTADNTVYAVANAAKLFKPVDKGVAVIQNDSHLHGPLSLALAPGGGLLVTMGDAVNPDPNATSELVQYTLGGTFVGELSLDPSAGAAFGLAVKKIGDQFLLGTVDDATNTLDLRSVKKSSIFS